MQCRCLIEQVQQIRIKNILTFFIFITKFFRMASTFVDEAIAANKVVVFSKTTCPFCSKAKSALRSIGAEFEVYEIERRPGAWKVLRSIF